MHSPDGVPPDWSDVASVLLAAASPPDEQELAMEAHHIAAARGVTGIQTAEPRRRRRISIPGLIAVGALLAIPALAAAKSLPDPAQHAVSRVLDKVGISVPGALDQPGVTVDDHPASTGQEISNIATTTGSTGVEKGAEVSTAASGGVSQAGQHGSASAHGLATSAQSSARVPTPNTGGTGTADTASDGKSNPGTSVADSSSGGRSAAGSSNARGGAPASVPSH
jgi:hypothetical protein